MGRCAVVRTVTGCLRVLGCSLVIEFVFVINSSTAAPAAAV